MDQIAIRATGVSKRFKLYKSLKSGPIKELLFFWRAKDFYQEFVAVRDVSLEVKRGEIVGVIGPNGAGKTTLLKMIAGLLPVDRGNIEVNGSVTALLALGVGVHPEFTGRENILYTGMLLGMTKREILRKMDAIIDFSELGDFIDQPFRTYSSGMRARLLFAVSMSVDPDILIIDEALATGDQHFLEKSYARIRELCTSGATILFVSHNLRQIEDMCSRCIVMDHGTVTYCGVPHAAINHYVNSIHSSERHKAATSERSVAAPARGTGRVRLIDTFLTQEGVRSDVVTIGRPCQLHIIFDAVAELPHTNLCVEFFSDKSTIPFAFVPVDRTKLLGTDEQPPTYQLSPGRGELVISFPQFVVGDGMYRCDVEFFSMEVANRFSYDDCHCYVRNALCFQAIYSHPSYFRRNTLTEIPHSSALLLKTECPATPLPAVPTDRYQNISQHPL